jgi:prolyl-tRNA synthetase
MPGFLGPIGLKIPMLADLGIHGMRGAVTGANEPDAHFTEVDQERDFTPAAFVDLRLAAAGDACPRCDGGILEAHRGIEVGQVFYLGTKYSESMGATYLDAEGRERPIEMGCYGIGISRMVAAAVEQNHDANGIVWPMSIAPFQVLLLPISYGDAKIRAATDKLYRDLHERGIEVMLDDRDERPGVKFKDADLVGIPLRVTVGAKGLEKNIFELRRRSDGKVEEVAVGEAADKIRRIVSEAIQA